MKPGLDKIGIGLGVVCMAGSLMWAFGVGPRPKQRNLEQMLSVPTDYESRTPPAMEMREATWGVPGAQSEDGLWVYDLFTPPKIYIDPQTGLFSVVPFQEQKVVPFGIRFVGIERDLYRIQYEGFIEEDPSDARKSLIRIYDREGDDSFLGRVGQSFPDKSLEIVDFQITRELDSNGFIERSEVLTIQDTRTGERVKLASGIPKYSDQLNVIFQSEGGSTQQFILHEAGESFECSGSIYRLLELNVEAGQVRIEKMNTETGSRTVQTLRSPFDTLSWIRHQEYQPNFMQPTLSNDEQSKEHSI